MELNKYQELAKEFDQNPDRKNLNSFIIPLFGVVGESGALISEFKKRLRDKHAHIKFKDNVEETIGNILWYVSNVASKQDLKLEDIALKNLNKIRERFPAKNQIICVTDLFDRQFPENEQIPREFEVEFKEYREGKNKKIVINHNGKKIGSELTDNSYNDDGYRFHDVFHFAYAAVLGWSPVVRYLMKIKRKSQSMVDEVEDGARASIIEEAVSAIVFQNAKNHKFYENIEKVDHFLIKNISNIVSHLEVSVCTTSEWERAILIGYSAFRNLVEHNGGRIFVDLNNRELTYKR